MLTNLLSRFVVQTEEQDNDTPAKHQIARNSGYTSSSTLVLLEQQEVIREARKSRNSCRPDLSDIHQEWKRDRFKVTPERVLGHPEVGARHAVPTGDVISAKTG